MHLKTFVAKDMSSALALVRHALGQDAVILHTRMVKRSGVWGMFQKPMVEITAADKALVAQYRKKRKAQTHQPPVATTPHAFPLRPESSPASHTASPSDTSHASLHAWAQLLHPGGTSTSASSPVSPTVTTAGDLIRKTYAAAMVELQKQNAATPAETRTSPRATKPAYAATAVTAANPVSPPKVTGSCEVVPQAPAVVPIATAQEQLTQEMRAVQRMVGKMIRRRQVQNARDEHGHANGTHASSDLPDPLMDQYLAMMKQEVAEEIAEEILGEVGRQLPGPTMHDREKVRAAVLESVAKMIPVDPLPMSFANGGDGRMRVIALIGPTGVGKTTTVAKLAANLKLRQKKNIGLVTIDTYRIAAVEQLRTYAQIIGVPLEVASSPKQVLAALSRCRSRGCEVVLMDTAGRSQRDDPKLEQLGLMLEAAQPDEVHLVLSSTCTQSVLEQAVERFSRLRTDRIIFTKLDEAVSFGVLLNVSKKLNKRLSFVTTGQEVPHDIEPGRAQRLAALVLGEGT